MQTMLIRVGDYLKSLRLADTFFMETKVMAERNSTTTSFLAIGITFCIALGIVCATLFFSMIGEENLMSKNIESAIAKGIDPVTVRCSYASNDDKICLAYAITHKTIDAPTVGQLRK